MSSPLFPASPYLSPTSHFTFNTSPKHSPSNAASVPRSPGMVRNEDLEYFAIDKNEGAWNEIESNLKEAQKLLHEAINEGVDTQKVSRELKISEERRKKTEEKLEKAEEKLEKAEADARQDKRRSLIVYGMIKSVEEKLDANIPGDEKLSQIREIAQHMERVVRTALP